MDPLTVVVIVLASLVGLVLLLAVVLPSSWTVRACCRVTATPEVVWQWLAVLRRWPDWTPWGESDESMVYAYSGPDEGPGASQSFRSKRSPNGLVTIRSAEPPTTLTYDVTIGSFTSAGTFTLTPDPADGTATQVEWRLQGDTGFNPVGKTLMVLMRRYLRRDFERGLARLAERAEAGPPPPLREPDADTAADGDPA